MAELKAIVVGAGITGVSTALWLRRAGAEVTLIDRIDPGDPGQTSYGNAGLLARCAIVPVSVPGLARKAPGMLLDPDAPLFLKWRYLPKLLPWLVPFLRNGRPEKLQQIVSALSSLTTDSVDQHISIAKGTSAEAYIQTGPYTYIYPDRQAFEADALGMNFRKENGFDINELDGPALRDRDPHLSEHYNFGAEFSDHGWITNPGAYVRELANHFRQIGGTFQKGDVAAINEGRISLKDGTELQAQKIIVATGAWSKSLTNQLGDKISLESERGYHVVLKSPNLRPPNPYMVADGKFAITPMDGCLRLAGTVEFGGLTAAPSDKPVQLLLRQTKRVYPHLEWTDKETWMGHRPSTSDSLPVLGHARNTPNVIYAFGSQHIGLTIGPRLGRMAADLALGTKTNLDLTPYRADRF